MPQAKPNWVEVPPRDWGEVQAHRVAMAIKSRRRSAQWLADETKKMGYEVTRTVISDLENGRRRYVTTAELTIFAQALRTAPIELLYPGPYKDPIHMVPHFKATEMIAAQWFSGLLDGAAVNHLATGEPRTLADDQIMGAEYRAAYDENLRQLRIARRIFELEGKLYEFMIDLRARKDEMSDDEREKIRYLIDDYRQRIDDLVGEANGR